jgi:hypothetical protein
LLSKLTAVPLAVVLVLLMCSSAQAAQMLGVQTHLLWGDVDQAGMERQLDLVKESGAPLTRVDVGWGSLQERGPDRFETWHLNRLDRVVDAAEARGIKLLLTFTNTPCWASSAPESERQGCAGEWWARDVTRWAPSDPSAYARALAFLVGRYKQRVAAWQIWNEPNLTSFWRASDPARAYAELVKAAYPAAKAAYPDSTILAGALSQSDHQFTQRLYDHGIRGHFDAFSFHPYSDDVSPADGRGSADPRYSFARGVPAVREVMVRNGDHRPLWLTESGWSTSTVRGAASYYNGVSEADQARFLREQATLVKRWPYVKALIWFNLLDRGSDRSSLVNNFGLRRVNGTAKPAWATFREAAADLARDDEPEPGPGPGPPGGEPEPGPSAPGGAVPPAGGPPPAGGTPPVSQPATPRGERGKRARRKRARRAARRAAARRAANRTKRSLGARR